MNKRYSLRISNYWVPNTCHYSIYWGYSREEDKSPCPHGIYILLGDIWGESFLGEEPEMRACLVILRISKKPVHL